MSGARGTTWPRHRRSGYARAIIAVYGRSSVRRFHPQLPREGINSNGPGRQRGKVSVSGVQPIPRFSDFHTPPPAAATYTVEGWNG